MDLKAKLARLSDAGPGSRLRTELPRRPPPLASEADRERRERIERLRAMMGRIVARQKVELLERPAGPSLEERIRALPGELRETTHGPVHVLEQILEPHHCHGRVPVAGALEASPSTVARLALDETFATVDPRRFLYLDTETTGLAGGAGTLPFLIGLGWFEDESLHLELLFLRRPGEERPMLGLLRDRLAAASCLVTYNGKAFDWPLIRNRFVMNRLPLPALPPHLDLLHMARRVFKRRLDGVRLVQMEEEVLGFRRERDVDGAEVPGLYLDFLRRGDPSELAVVFEHNGNDIAALAAILAKMARDYSSTCVEEDPRDRLGYALAAERAGDEGRALGFARLAVEGGADAATAFEAHLLLARLHRRQGDLDGEESALLAALCVSVGGGRRSQASLALAKLYEHRRKDLRRALRHARLTEEAEGVEAQGRRLGRLYRRLSGRGALSRGRGTAS